MTEIVFNARRTLNVLSADTLPRSTNSVTYLEQGKDHTQNTHTMTETKHGKSTTPAHQEEERRHSQSLSTEEKGGR